MRTPEGIDYEAVLDDLRDKKAKLETAIAAIEQFVLGRPASSAPERPVAADAVAPTNAPAPTKIESDTFFGMSATDAAKKYLQMVKKPKSMKAIHDAVLEGGFTTSAKNFYSNLYTALMRSDEFANLGGRKGWGLAEWYPGRRVDQQSKGRSEGKPEATEEKVVAAPATPAARSGGKKANGREPTPSPSSGAPEPTASEQPDEQSHSDAAN